MAMTEEIKALATIQPNTAPMSVRELVGHVELIREAMQKAMQKGQHYGTIPGCGDKPTLLQPGAQILLNLFHLNPDPILEVIEMGGGHREYRFTVRLLNNAGVFVGSGVGSCSTMESKYRYRGGERKCPACGKETIIKGKAEYGGGWLCWTKKGGCGAKFGEKDPAIIGQEVGKVENPDIADVYNTCEKMAYKRALVSATLTRTAASDIFTQDIEDNRSDAQDPVSEPFDSTPARKTSSAPKSPPQPPTATTSGPPVAPPGLINDGQRKRMMFLFGKKALRKREDYIAYVNSTMHDFDEPTVLSTKALTSRQAQMVIRCLEEDLGEVIPDDRDPLGEGAAHD